jgi:hypothetical protein
MRLFLSVCWCRVDDQSVLCCVRLTSYVSITVWVVLGVFGPVALYSDLLFRPENESSKISKTRLLRKKNLGALMTVTTVA